MMTETGGRKRLGGTPLRGSCIRCIACGVVGDGRGHTLTGGRRCPRCCLAREDLDASLGHAPGEVAVSILAEIIASRRAAATASAPVGLAPERDAVEPVCAMSVAMVAASLHAEHSGVTFWFCGPGCRAAFLDDPARSAP
jgi:YHS domain-containing protein